MDKLLFRNQFILGPHYIHSFEAWRKTDVDGRIFITSHPDLNACRVTEGPRSLILLGYLIDPRNPEEEDRAILEGLLRNYGDRKGLIKATYALGGRWVLILKDNKDIFLFNDATGLRQVFYTGLPYGEEVWCASQPSLLASMLNLKKDETALGFLGSYSRKNREFWIPGDSSLFREVKHLLPNHYLDFAKGAVVRFWPDERAREVPFDRAIERTSLLLKGLVRGASKRFGLVLSLTSGLDSRLVLSASKGIEGGIEAMSIQKGAPDFPDVKIPSLLAGRLGIGHEVIKPAKKIRDEFRIIYERNALFPHETWIGEAQALADRYGREKAVMTGSAAEIARCWYWKYRSLKATPQRLSRIKGMMSRFAVREFGKWIAGLKGGFNYHPLDLFCWEQGAGNWLAMCQLEFDLSWKEIFTPFNCRELLLTMLSVDERYRRPHDHAFQRHLIRSIWPEVLAQEINPHKRKSFPGVIKAGIKFKLHELKYSIREYAL